MYRLWSITKDAVCAVLVGLALAFGIYCLLADRVWARNVDRPVAPVTKQQEAQEGWAYGYVVQSLKICGYATEANTVRQWYLEAFQDARHKPISLYGYRVGVRQAAGDAAESKPEMRAKACRTVIQEYIRLKRTVSPGN